MRETKLEQALIPVDGKQIPTLLDENGDVWVALRPVVNALGLDWGTQRKKLKNLKEKGVVILTTPLKDSNGKTQEMLTINLYDLPVYLYSININKVRPELREKIKKFQVETTHAIREYWKNKIKKEREEIQQLKEEYNRLVKELRKIPTYEEYKELKMKYELMQTMIDVLVMDMEKAKPVLNIMFQRLEHLKKGIPIKTVKDGKIVKEIIKVI